MASRETDKSKAVFAHQISLAGKGPSSSEAKCRSGPARDSAFGNRAGFVSLFMDTSSEIIHSLLPAFLVTVLGATALSVGIIERVAHGRASKRTAARVQQSRGVRKAALAESRDRGAATGEPASAMWRTHGLALCVEP